MGDYCVIPASVTLISKTPDSLSMTLAVAEHATASMHH